MAKRVKAVGLFDTENPTNVNNDPRFDPDSDVENAIAHGEEPEDVDAVGDADDIQTTVRRSLERAVRHYEENLEPDQKEATDYYFGRPFGDEEEGRSKVVSTDVRDATQAQLPSLMRIFFGPEHAVEFRPRGPDDDETARQMTDFINYLVAEENPGFLIFHSWFKDALVRRIGVVKWWQDEFYRVEGATYSGLGEEELMALYADESSQRVEVLGLSNDEAGRVLFDVRVERRETGGCPRFAAVPPEEFVFTPNARSLESAPMVAHVREVAVEELVALGIDEDLIEEAQGKTKRVEDGEMEFARQFNAGADGLDDGAEDVDDSQRPVLFAEAYALIDADDDGVAELRMFQCVGPEFEIANGDGLGEVVDELPFAVLTPEPEPHTIIGLSNYDLLKDVQRVKSQVLRGTLNSLAAAIEPKTEVVSSRVNMQDLMNPEISGIVRVDAPGQMREITHAFIGKDTLPVLAYYDEIRENRTGQTKAAQGLDADSLQSSTKAAVAATLTASQQRIEMIARVFAETGVKRLYKGLLRLAVKHQNEKRMVRLRGQYVQIDPRHWDATMDVSVNVALGSGTTEEKINLLSGILAAQKELLQAGSPLVSNVELRNTLGRAVELAGFRNSDQFFKPWGPDQEAQMQQQMAQQPPPPDPAAQLIEVERMKAESQMMIEQFKAQTQQAMEAQKLELDRWKAQMQDDRERDKIARESVLKEYEIELKNAATIEDSQIKAKVAAERAALDADVRREQARIQTGGDS